MSHSGPRALEGQRALTRQIPSFLIIGALGFCLDAALTIFLVKLGVSAWLARLPAFAIVTLINFTLNRAFTFHSSRAPWLAALMRYVLVCLAGLSVNYAIYASGLALAPAFGVAVSPAALTLFVACGTGAATLVTFLGFRSYAFRS
jgi:putative flippase GtrA